MMAPILKSEAAVASAAPLSPVAAVLPVEPQAARLTSMVRGQYRAQDAQELFHRVFSFL